MNRTDPIGTKVKTFSTDMYATGIKYAITINPDNVHQYAENTSLTNSELVKPSDRFVFVNRYINNKIVYKYKELGMKFEVYPEIKHPNDDDKKSVIPRIHYHGWITFTTVQGLNIWYMYLYTRIKKVSMINVKPIECKKSWHNYVYKNHKTMRQICKYHKTQYGINTAKCEWI